MTGPQQSLLNLPPRTHTGDPATSHRAEEKIRRTSLRTHAAKVLAVVDAVPGLTPTGVTERLAGDPDFAPGDYERRDQVRKRLSDLKVSVPPRIRTTTTEGEREYRCFAVRSA